MANMMHVASSRCGRTQTALPPPTTQIFPSHLSRAMKPRRQNSVPAQGSPHHLGHQRNKSGRATSVKPPAASPALTHSAATTPAPGAAAMAPELKYAQNLKVLKRADPSIESIVDQFPHVCIYQYDFAAHKWEKRGFEGSFFIFERRAYPPYGFFILNRMGMEDYVQYMYPEDALKPDNALLLYRAFKDYTAERLSRARSLPPHELNLPMETYTTWAGREPSPDDPQTSWKLLAEPERESGETIGLWMHAEEADRPDVKAVVTSLHEYICKGERYPLHLRTTPPAYAPAFPKLTIHDLFASATPAPISAPAPSTSTSKPEPEKRGLSLLDSIFASATPTPASPAPAPTGHALLSSIFASATPTPAPITPVSSSAHEIHSPKPAVAALPQILTQDVIHQLLGAPPAAAASTLPSAGLGLPSNSTPILPNVASAPVIHSRDAATTEDGVNATDELKRMLQLPTSSGGAGATGTGDRTPRAQEAPRAAPIGARAMPPPSPRVRPTSVVPAPTDGHANLMNGVLKDALAKDGGAGSRAGTPRRLVPFHDNSTAWPYPRAPLDDRDSDEDVGVIELDFADTAVLSMPDALPSAHSHSHMRGGSVDGSFGGEGGGSVEGGEAKKKKSRRALKRERERAERAGIEGTWDAPPAVADPSSTVPVDAEKPLDFNALGPDLSPLDKAKKMNGHGHKTNGSTVEVIPRMRRQTVEVNGGVSGSGGGGTKIDMQTLFASVPSTPAIPLPPPPIEELGRWAAGALRPGISRVAFAGEVAGQLLNDQAIVDGLYSVYRRGL
ncbi:hypothetical protein PENSPDRAFT_374649 [Peniophora sp. CONT]|nr:hypothetical protein PENSPDRAFT_374649 [Peniophora sp. CONT]